MNLLIDIGLWLAYLMTAVGILALLYFAVMRFVTQFISNPKKALTSLFVVLGFVVMFVAAYLLSSSTDLSPEILEKSGASSTTSKFIGAGLISTYILFGLVLLTLVYVEVAKVFKK